MTHKNNPTSQESSPGSGPSDEAIVQQQQQLAPLRQQIDQLDRQLVELLNQRARVVVQIGHIKRGGHTPIYVADREHQVLGR